MKKGRFTTKALLQFLVCGLGSFAIFYVLFCRASFYDAFVEAMGVTNTQFGICYAVYGWIAVVGYLVGAFVADRVAPRWLMFISFTVTGICNFILGLWPSYGVTLALYGIMGVSTTVTFWDCMLKCNRIFGREIGDENKAFSWLQVVRGIGEIAVSTLIIVIFSQFINAVAGLRFVVWTYAFILIAFGIISIFVFDDGKESEESGKSEEDRVMSDESVFRQTIRLLKNPDLWLCILIAFGGYNIGSCFGSYFGDMAGCFGATTTAMAFIGTLDAWMKPVGALAGSFMTTKKGPTFLLQGVTWIYMVIIAVILLIPKTSAFMPVFLGLMCLEIALTGLFRSQKYIQIREAGIPLKDTGCAFGIIATVIYSADAFMPTFIGMWLDKYDEVTAYNHLYMWLLASGALTIVAVFIFRRRNKARIASVIAEDNAK
ncbi:MAG: MFS transporter [Lachnospiraceae bacterium]|nr:MFS transporter [Lachnospiraceae bacterium]